MTNLSVGQVLRHVRNPDEAMRLNAVKAFFAIGSAEAGQGLRLMLKDPSPNVQRLATQAYQQLEQRLGGPGSIPDGPPASLTAMQQPQAPAAPAQPAPPPAAPPATSAPQALPASAGAGKPADGGLAALVGGGGTAAAARGIQAQRPEAAAPPPPAPSPGGGDGGLAGLVGGGGALGTPRAAQVPEPVGAAQDMPGAAEAEAAAPPPALNVDVTSGPLSGDAQQYLAQFQQGLQAYGQLEEQLKAGYANLVQLRQKAVSSGVPGEQVELPGVPGASFQGEEGDFAEFEAEARRAAIRNELRPALSAAVQAAARADRQTPPLDPPTIQQLAAVAARILSPCVEMLYATLRDPEVTADLAEAAARAVGQLRPPGGLEAIKAGIDGGRLEPSMVQALGWLGDPRALPILRDLYGQDRYAHLKPSISHAVTDIPGDEADAFIRTVLQDPDTSVRTAVVTLLGESRRPGFAEDLLKTLGTEDDYLGMALVRALANYAPDDPQISHRLSEELARIGSDDRMAVAALSAIGKTGNPELLGALEPFAKSREDRVRKAALVAIQQLDVPPAPKLKALRPILVSNKDAKWKAEVAVEVAKLGDEKGLESLSEMVRSNDRAEQLHGCWGVGEVAPENAVELIQPFVDAPGVDLQMAAARALGNVPGGAALPTLVKMAKGQNVEVRVAAIDALAKQGPSAHPQIGGLLEVEYEAVGLAACIRALAATDPSPPQSYAAVAGYAENPDARIRQAFVDACGKVMNDDAKDPLLQLVRDEEHRVRNGALRLLWTWGDMRAVFALHDLFLGTEPGQKVGAAMACEELGKLQRSLDQEPNAGRLVAALRAHPDYPGGGV